MSVQQMIQTTVAINQQRGQRLVLVAGGDVYMSVALGIPNVVVNGGDVFASGDQIQMCEVSGPGTVYMVAAGAAIKQLNALTNSMATYTATAGTAPVGATCCCIYRARLIVAGVDGDPNNFFASRSGTRTDWDYSQQDELAAFSGNSKVSDMIVALMPFVDDYLVIGCDHSIYRMTGDIQAGGSIDRLSEKIGVIGPDAWTSDAAGNIYFVGNGGFYRIGAAGGIEDLSSTKISRYFRDLDRASYIIQCRWDQVNKGCWIFVTARSSGDTTTHLWWDARTGGFFPMQFPYDHGPTASVVFDGDSATDSTLLIGGRDGFVRYLDEDATSDDGEVINSFVYLAQRKPAGDLMEATLNELEFIQGEVPNGFAETDWNLNWTVMAGKGQYDALVSPDETATGSLTTSGRQDPLGMRVTANTFLVKLSNSTLDKIWSIDHVDAEFLPAGRQR